MRRKFLVSLLGAGASQVIVAQSPKALQKKNRDLRLEKGADPPAAPTAATSGVSAGTGARSALVIGNGAYEGVSRLRNPLHDAEDMAKLLEGSGFRVTHLADASLSQMNKSLDAFAGGLKPGSVALFYFAGHGMQVSQENYLIPVDFRYRDPEQAKAGCLAAGRVQARLQTVNPGINLLVFDACRNNPFRKDAAPGLSPMDSRLGTLIAFATGPGSTASENPAGRNGLYTQYLLESLRMPIDLVAAFRRTRQEVFDASGGRQHPWFHEDILQAFYLKEPAPGGPGALGASVDQVSLRGQQLYANADYKGAAVAFEQAVRVNPENPYLHNAAGAAYLSQGLHAQAVTRFNRAIQLKLDYGAAYYNRGLAYLRVPRYEQAVEDFTWALDQDNTNPVAYKLRARAYFGTRDYDSALTDLDRSLELNPSDPESYTSRAVVRNRQGKYKEALADAERALQLRGTLCEAMQARQYAKRGLGDTAGATADGALAAKLCQ